MPKAKTDKPAPKKRSKALVDDMPPSEEVVATPKKPVAAKKKKSVWDGVLPENAAKPAKRELPKKNRASEPVYIQPAEVVVGRYYEVSPKLVDEQKLVGELVANEGSVQTLQVWREGRPVDGAVERVFFGNRDVREISRETCFELSHSHIRS